MPENGSYMVASLGPANNFTGKVLDSLEFGSVLMLACVAHNNITETFLVCTINQSINNLYLYTISI